MFKDEAIEELRERRRKLFKDKYHNSVKELVQAGQEYQRRHPERFAENKGKRLRKVS